MLENIQLDHILFLDIETVSAVSQFGELPDRMKSLWAKKAEQKNKDVSAEEFYSNAGIFAEFGKIVCISVGFFKTIDNERIFRIKSFSNDDEKMLLIEFSALLKNHFNKKEHNLCAHNGKEFDFPFIARRMLINGIKIPTLLDVAGKKPWETSFIDTMELWKFGDFKSYTSLELLAAIFNIDTPKDDITGADVGKVYWQQNDLPRITKYCQKDVLTIAQLVLRFKNEPLISEDNVNYL
jgi:DNA polymerase elongation subunit (family B)